MNYFRELFVSVRLEINSSFWSLKTGPTTALPQLLETLFHGDNFEIISPLNPKSFERYL